MGSVLDWICGLELDWAWGVGYDLRVLHKSCYPLTSAFSALQATGCILPSSAQLPIPHPAVNRAFGLCLPKTLADTITSSSLPFPLSYGWFMHDDCPTEFKRFQS